MGRPPTYPGFISVLLRVHVVCGHNLAFLRQRGMYMFSMHLKRDRDRGCRTRRSTRGCTTFCPCAIEAAGHTFGVPRLGQENFANIHDFGTAHLIGPQHCKHECGPSTRMFRPASVHKPVVPRQSRPPQDPEARRNARPLTDDRVMKILTVG